MFDKHEELPTLSTKTNRKKIFSHNWKRWVNDELSCLMSVLDLRLIVLAWMSTTKSLCTALNSSYYKKA